MTNDREVGVGVWFVCPCVCVCGLCRIVDDGHSDWCEVIPHVVLISVSLVMSDVEHLRMCLDRKSVV